MTPEPLAAATVLDSLPTFMAAWRSGAKVTIPQAARMAGVAPGVWRSVESGASGCNVSTAVLILRCLGGEPANPRTPDRRTKDTTHGTDSAYVRGCRCGFCTEAHRIYSAAQRAMRSA